MIRTLCIFLLCVFATNIYSQIQREEDALIKADTSATSEQYSKRTLIDLFEGKPGKAALFSLVLPGAGQAYNKKWWKVPIALGIEGAFIYNIVHQTNNFRRLDRKWRTLLAGESINCDINYMSPFQIKPDRDAARKLMEWSWVYWSLAHVVVSLEAFVNAHLLEFDVSDDLSFRIKPEQIMIPNAAPIPTIGFIYHIN